MSQDSESRPPDKELPPTFGDRMRFVMWLSALRLGTWNAKEFAGVVGKQETQIARWVREKPKPGWDVVNELALPVGVNPVWLLNAAHPDAVEPPLFAEWLQSRRAFRRRIEDARREAEAKANAGTRQGRTQAAVPTGKAKRKGA